MGKNKKKRSDVVYSTDPGFDYSHDGASEEETLLPKDQSLYVFHDRKQRKGKTVTVVEGFVGSKEDLNDLSKKIKAACGVGGSVKEGVILIQGEIREKVAILLEKESYRVTRKGG